VATNVFDLLLGLGLGLVLGWIYLVLWKARYTASIRQDAVRRSQAITAGKVHEQLLPYLPGFPFNPKDVRFLGSPIDLVVFDGLADGRVRRIVFVEVKTGHSGLTTGERSARGVVPAGEVEWVEIRAARPLANGVA
jgi:predicted Holliday junction resolvase-like endonuclease